MKNLSVNIDMGASNNGVYVAILNDNKIAKKIAFNVKFDRNSLNFSKTNRTAKRHTRRMNSRKKFLNRLIDEIFESLNFSKKQKDSIYSLTKNRGFTFLNLKFDREILDDDIQKFNKIDGYEFANCRNLIEFEQNISLKLQEFDTQESLDFIKNQIEILKLFSSQNKPKYIKEIINIFTITLSEIEKNAKHRKKYFLDIQNELEKAEFSEIIQKTKLKKDEFYCLICNLSNLQNRVLRRYFGAKFDKKFDDAKLYFKLRQNALNLHYKTAADKENLKNLKTNFAKFKTAFEFLIKTDPNVTIPPFEDRNNIKPLKCQSLVLKDLTKSLEIVLEKILQNENFSRLAINEFGEIQKDFSKFSQSEKRLFMQRFLDISKDFLNDQDLYPRNLDKNSEIFKQVVGLKDDEISDLREFAHEYYTEINLSKLGFFDDKNSKILKICNNHTPYKNNSKLEHLNALFRSEFTHKDVKELEKFIGDKNNKFGNKLLKNFLNDISNAKKDFANKFYFALENKILLNQKEQKTIDNLLKNYVKAINLLSKHNAKLKFEITNEKKLKQNFNLLSQLSDIMLDFSKGFNKTCIGCTIENRLRSGKISFASRLSANSARLINGRIEMFLDRLAFEICKQIQSEIGEQGFSEITINLEQNRFNFEKDIKEIVSLGKTKSDDENTENNKNDNNKSKENKETKEQNLLICPYSGKKITLENCEYDHIIARNDKKFGEIFNSPANLIPVYPAENLKKGNKRYDLYDLDKAYKEKICNKLDIKLDEFEDFICNTMKEIEPKNYTNFYNLTYEEQMAFRHALFLHDENETFKKALKILQIDKNKTPSNGTAKRLVALICKKIPAFINAKKLPKINIEFIDAKAVNAMRREFAKENIALAKQNPQPPHSHCIDAMCVFYASRQNLSSKNMPNFDFANDILLSKSDVIVPQNKSFLELETNQIGSKSLFDETIYEICFDNTKIDAKKFKILNNLNALKIKENGIKRDVLQGEIFNKSAKYFIDKNIIFNEYFRAFEARDIKAFKSIKFLDKMLISFVRKDIFKIFFDGKKFIKPNPKTATKNVTKFYEILKQNESKLILKTTQIDNEFVKRLYRETFYPKNKISRLRNKNRIMYSLKFKAEKVNFVIRRNGGFEGLANKDIATRTFVENNAFKKIKFHSKNVLPIKITDIIEILNLGKKAVQIYEISVPKNLLQDRQEINSLDFKLTQDSRHLIKVEFKKQNFPFKFDDISGEITIKNGEFNTLIDEWLNGKFKDILGKPRNLKAEILRNDDRIFEISYCVDQTLTSHKQFFLEIFNETSCH